MSTEDRNNKKRMSYRLLDAIGELPEETILEAEKTMENSRKKHRKIVNFTRWASVAAGGLLVVGLGMWQMNNGPKPADTTSNNAEVAVTEEAVSEEAISDASQEYASDAASETDEYINKEEEAVQMTNGEQGLNAFYLESVSGILAEHEGENVVYSPINAYLALAMLAEVTDGESRQQILDVLGENSLEELEIRVQELLADNTLDVEGGERPGRTCKMANSLWTDESLKLHEDVATHLEDVFMASAHSGEMGSKAFDEEFRSWLNEHTENLLKDQVQDEKFSPSTIAALASTIYLKANWFDQFDEFYTEDDIFHSVNGEETVPFMHTTEFGVIYYGEHFTVASRNLYGVGNMLFILPEEGVTPQELVKDPEYREFIRTGVTDRQQWQRKMVDFSIPRFDISTQQSLIPVLRQMGVVDVFDSNLAKFSAWDQREEDYVSEIKQGARLKIDEEGVEAAAYTVVAVMESAMEIEETVEFTLDRPFLFQVYGPQNDILFSGVVQTIE